MPRKPHSLSPVKLLCESQNHPIGLGHSVPTLSWQLPPASRIGKVVAYEIEAARSAAALKKGEPDLWQSGKVREDWASRAPYAGATLGSRDRVFWRVRVWSDGAEPSAWSAVARFEIGLLAISDWVAKWIAASVMGGRRTRAAAPHLRKAFELSQAVRKARLHLTARGLYICEINGQRITEDELAPGWTDYTKRIPVRCYDVTSFLLRGDNVLGATLGDGWYCGRIAWKDRQHYGERPSLLAQLELEMADGTIQTVATDETWQWKTGALLENDMITGESYDARRALGNWSAPGFDAAHWQHCELEVAPEAIVEPARGLPCARRSAFSQFPVSPPTAESPEAKKKPSYLIWDKTFRVEFG